MPSAHLSVVELEDGTFYPALARAHHFLTQLTLILHLTVAIALPSSSLPSSPTLGVQTHRDKHADTYTFLLNGLCLYHIQTVDAKKELAAAEKKLAATEKELTAAEITLAAAKKELTAAEIRYDTSQSQYDEQKRQFALSAVQFALTELHFANQQLHFARTELHYARAELHQLRNPNPKVVMDCSLVYEPHETALKNVWDEELPNIKRIPVNTGQTSLTSAKQLPWNIDCPFKYILDITLSKSCQLAQSVINFLTDQRLYAHENGVHPMVNYFVEIVVKSAGGNDWSLQRDTSDVSSTSESTGSSKAKLFRVDVLILLRGLALVRFEEKRNADGDRLLNAQQELVKKISMDWLLANCNVPFIIGIAVAGEIWTFHRITWEHVSAYNTDKKSVLPVWFRLDTSGGVDRLRGVVAAVHIASLLRLFRTLVHPRTVPFEKKKERNCCTILITQKEGLPHVKKWYVS